MLNSPSAIVEAITRPWGTQDSLLRRTIASGARLLRPGRAAETAATRVEPVVPPVADSAGAEASRAAAPFDRAIWSNRLWGEGMTLPGGAEEVLRLSALLPLAPEHTLLLAGLGARAAGGVVSGARGCFVAAHDLLPPEAPGPGRGSSRRVTSAALAPEAPDFRLGYHHHALLLEPFRRGGAPEGLLRATAAALRDGGEVVLLDLVSCDDAPESRWLHAEARRPPPPDAALPAALEQAGFRIHVVEDAGPRQQRAVLQGWASLLAALRSQETRPAPREAAALVLEAEAWLLRLRLLREGRLRLLRWHATKRRTVV
ncbi:hypothetical protein KPL78_11755 [Roseomonas sp. HJA6]|uniref:Class I SAM-dependent methyltransferase n=1 Tax=Roseomonas alba TaxID=2846776 RepID=A0ABS7A890_9PROT|nr:hypothetical protein [Neoroseomonas alba]MBW6398529.1 hypothetical protein [Neoroseomonas alba]